MINLRKLEKWFFYLLIFFLPFQTRIIFKSWGSGFNEWNLAAFYLTDALWLAVVFLWLIRIFRRHAAIKVGKAEIALFVFLGISALSLINAQNFWLGVFRELKLIEFGFLFLYLKNNPSFTCHSRGSGNPEKCHPELVSGSESLPIGQASVNPDVVSAKTGDSGSRIKYGMTDSGGMKYIPQIIVVSGILQALIAIGQFVRQKSFGLSFLDESPLGPNISGVAKIVVDGEKLIRPYGLTPHPNILAVFLLIAIFCALVLFIQKNKDCRWGGAVFCSLAIAILTFAFFITFSRAAIVIGLLAIFGWLVYQFFKSGRQWYILNTIVIFGICCLLITILFWPYLASRFDIESGLTNQSFNLRAFYNQVALNFIGRNPILGAGTGNFVWAFQNNFSLSETWMYQPAHNIYLLIAAETGLLGLLAFLAFLLLTIRSAWRGRADFTINCLLFIVFCLLLFGLVDHFEWDLQQGQLMFWLFLGILAAISHSEWSEESLARLAEARAKRANAR